MILHMSHEQGMKERKGKKGDEATNSRFTLVLPFGYDMDAEGEIETQTKKTYTLRFGS